MNIILFQTQTLKTLSQVTGAVQELLNIFTSTGKQILNHMILLEMEILTTILEVIQWLIHAQIIKPRYPTMIQDLKDAQQL